MPPDSPAADEAFAGLLLLRCPARVEEILRILPDPRRQQLRELTAKNAAAPPAELKNQITRSLQAEVAARRGRAVEVAGPAFESLPPILQKYLAKRAGARATTGSEPSR